MSILKSFAAFGRRTAPIVPIRGVIKPKIGLKGMIAAYDPGHHAPIMIREGPKIIGGGMVEIG